MNQHDEDPDLGMVLGLVLVALLIGAVLWVALAGWSDRPPTSTPELTAPQ